MQIDEVRGALASGGSYRATAYLVEFYDPAGQSALVLDLNHVTAVRRSGNTVVISRLNDTDVTVNAASLDDAGRLETVIRARLAPGHLPAAPATPGPPAGYPAGAAAPPAKSGRGLLFLAAGCLVVLLLCVAVGAAGLIASNRISNRVSDAIESVDPGSSGSLPPGQSYTVGEEIDTGKLLMTVQRVEFSDGTEQSTPTVGYRYLMVELSFFNQSNDEVLVSEFSFDVRDRQGRQFPNATMNSVIVGARGLTGTVLPHEAYQATGVFEVPTDATGLRLVYDRLLADAIVVDLGV